MNRHEATTDNPMSAYGSFKDSLRAPIHRWFTYPAGYSHKLVECKIREYGLKQGSWIADPFLGTGTTSVSAKMVGVNSIGVEAHPFVYWIAKTKLCMEYDGDTLGRDAQTVLQSAKSVYEKGIECDDFWPELVYKCFREDTLRRLYALRMAIERHETTEDRRDFLKVALTATLRIVTSAGAGWPYIAPSKYAERTVQRDAFEEFSKRCNLMLHDISTVSVPDLPQSVHRLINGDARSMSKHAPRESIDLMLTSPPYLNNYDYADRTRLETYFWGMYENWGQITHDVRDHLIIAATTQIRRTAMEDVRNCPGIKATCPQIHSELMDVVRQLSKIRTIKRGKKSYDLMVVGYFEDMLKVLRETLVLQKNGSKFVLVLGDSAPYGIHIRTDEIVGRLGVAIGYSDYTVEVIRARGGEMGWKHSATQGPATRKHSHHHQIGNRKWHVVPVSLTPQALWERELASCSRKPFAKASVKRWKRGTALYNPIIWPMGRATSTR